MNVNFFLLSACSGYFEQMFDVGDSKQTHMIIISEVTYEDLISILEFAYKGETTIKSENYERFLKAAEFLQLKGVSNTKKFGQKMPIAPPTPPPDFTYLYNSKKSVNSSISLEESLESGIMKTLQSIGVKPEPITPKAKENQKATNSKRKAKDSGRFSPSRSFLYLSFTYLTSFHRRNAASKDIQSSRQEC